jgi:luciferase family oxidoreductase group 1
VTLPLSILDLMPIPNGGDGAQAIHNTLELARLSEELGYTRYWLAEHHNFPGLAAVAPEVLIGVIARETSRIRVGAGGVLLPNYAPLKVAELFRTLEGLAPGRIDLGIGRAPNQDPRTALALRGSEAALGAANDIAQLLAELKGYAQAAPSTFPEGHPLREVIASPEGVPLPPIWLLGSGQLSAQIAAEGGHGYAAAYHFSPSESAKAIQAYRAHFQPSAQLAHPYAIASISVICAETDELAEDLRLVSELTAVRRLKGERLPPPSIAEARAYAFTAEERENLKVFTHVTGSPARVHAELNELAAQLDVDELILVISISDHALRRRSYELVAEAFALSAPPVALPV